MSDNKFAFLCVAGVLVAIVLGTTAGAIADKYYPHRSLFCTEANR